MSSNNVGQLITKTAITQQHFATLSPTTLHHNYRHVTSPHVIIKEITVNQWVKTPLTDIFVWALNKGSPSWVSICKSGECCIKPNQNNNICKPGVPEVKLMFEIRNKSSICMEGIWESCALCLAFYFILNIILVANDQKDVSLHM